MKVGTSELRLNEGFENSSMLSRCGSARGGVCIELGIPTGAESIMIADWTRNSWAVHCSNQQMRDCGYCRLSSLLKFFNRQ